jgi:hypothetical protein
MDGRNGVGPESLNPSHDGPPFVIVCMSEDSNLLFSGLSTLIKSAGILQSHAKEHGLVQNTIAYINVVGLGSFNN